MDNGRMCNRGHQSCIYGTRQFGIEDQGWVAWFTIAAVLGKTITIYGDGKQIRDTTDFRSSNAPSRSATPTSATAGGGSACGSNSGCWHSTRATCPCRPKTTPPSPPLQESTMNFLATLALAAALGSRFAMPSPPPPARP